MHWENTTNWAAIIFVNQNRMLAISGGVTGLRPPFGPMHKGRIVSIPLTFDHPSIKSDQVAMLTFAVLIEVAPHIDSKVEIHKMLYI